MLLWVYGIYKCFNSFSAGTVFIRQIMTYKDSPRTERGNNSHGEISQQTRDVSLMLI